MEVHTTDPLEAMANQISTMTKKLEKLEVAARKPSSSTPPTSIEAALEKLAQSTASFVQNTHSFMNETRSTFKNQESALRNLENQVG
ncbi:hypothetical protein PIB30_105656 [Stylosanthes scabra]|uniref:Uncharacterized protein n=1 Tax=Stylosanthes scabra TaxID=79078 RepID=A0ABU6XZC5_9FABA|nr:hypothetical protein [Stylosanthes scabra]